MKILKPIILNGVGPAQKREDGYDDGDGFSDGDIFYMPFGYLGNGIGYGGGLGASNGDGGSGVVITRHETSNLPSLF